MTITLKPIYGRLYRATHRLCSGWSADTYQTLTAKASGPIEPGESLELRLHGQRDRLVLEGFVESCQPVRGGLRVELRLRWGFFGTPSSGRTTTGL